MKHTGLILIVSGFIVHYGGGTDEKHLVSSLPAFLEKKKKRNLRINNQISVLGQVVNTFSRLDFGPNYKGLFNCLSLFLVFGAQLVIAR